jgi:hypothetical protein
MKTCPNCGKETDVPFHTCASIASANATLRWYEQQAKYFRKSGKTGDEARWNLDAAGGLRAHETLAATKGVKP